jgi:hypothetical protein
MGPTTAPQINERRMTTPGGTIAVAGVIALTVLN